MIAVDFVPNNFHWMTAEEMQKKTNAISSDEPPLANENMDVQRRAAMMQAIKNAMRQPQSGEKRDIGTIERVECTNKAMFFFFKTATQTLKLATASPQSIQMRAFTPEIEQVQFGCGLKQIDVSVVFTYKENSDAKTKSGGGLSQWNSCRKVSC